MSKRLNIGQCIYV